MTARQSLNNKIDRRMFRHTVVQTKVANAPHQIPRGGIRL